MPDAFVHLTSAPQGPPTAADAPLTMEHMQQFMQSLQTNVLNQVSALLDSHVAAVPVEFPLAQPQVTSAIIYRARQVLDATLTPEAAALGRPMPACAELLSLSEGQQAANAAYIATHADAALHTRKLRLDAINKHITEAAASVAHLLGELLQAQASDHAVLVNERTAIGIDTSHVMQ